MADFLPLFGYAPNRAGTDAFLASLAKPTLAQAGPDLALDEGRDVFLGSALLKCDPSWKRGSQKIGSCVGWGWALSCDILAACDIHVRNEAETYGGRVLEASVYAFSRVEVRGSRNLGGDGSYGGAAAKAVTKYGTLHYGQDYGGQRFTDNSGTREKEWGRDGVPDSLEKYAAQHKVSSVALVKTFEEAAKAIQNGYPVAVCSMQALLCVNSWGDCYSGDVDATLPVQFQRSAGYVRAETCTRMLAGEDSFALSGYSGFAPRTMPGNWLEGIL
jgi:hypothetical protein